jgi:N utilization substance protein A
MAFRRKSAEPETPKPKDPMLVGKQVLELANLLMSEKRISEDTVFQSLESAIQLAALRHFGVEDGVHVQIDRSTGVITARHGEEELSPEMLGRIAAQSAKQVMIQKFREAESDNVFSEYNAKKGDLVQGAVTRADSGTVILSLGKTEALLPRSEQIPGESHHHGDRVKAVVYEVRKTGNRVKVVLSRAHPDFVKCLFEEEIPEIADRTIEIRAIAREAGYRTKLGVSSIDMKVDCVGACVGVRGSRIKTIIEELNGERIDIVRWNDSLQVLIPNALQPAKVSDVFTYPRLGRAIVLVEEDQLSLAIGRRGQNVRLASDLVSLDLEIMTTDELAIALERAERWFGQLPHADEDLVQSMIGEGFLSYDDLASIDGATLLEFCSSLSAEQADEIIEYAEDYAETMEEAVREEQRQLDEAEEENRRATLAAEEEARASLLNAEPDADATTEGQLEQSEASVQEESAEIVHEDGVSTVTSPDHPIQYHEGPPTDSAAVEEAVEHEEYRTGDDGEQTARVPEATQDGETA